MFCRVVILALGLLVSGCEWQTQINRAEEVTLEDGYLYIRDRHDRRKDVRNQYYALVDDTSAECRMGTIDDCNAAIEKANLIISFWKRHYPELVSIDLLQDVREKITLENQGLHDLGREPASESTPPVGNTPGQGPM